MSVTRLLRKDKRNKAKATNRLTIVKQLTRRPTLKNVDVEAIKKEFEAKKQQ